MLHTCLRRSRTVAVFLILILVGSSPKSEASVDSTLMRIRGVNILVADMNEAIAFYSGKLGFDVLSTTEYPQRVELKSAGLRLHLSKTDKKAQYDYAGSIRTTFGFQANDLLATRDKLIAQGVRFLEPEPVKVGVGIATTFKDPSGNVLYLLEQQVGDRTPFEEPRIYNVGFHVPDVKAAQRLYCDVLGFVVRTDRYFPAIPLGHADGSFAFMLHEKSDLTPRRSKYPTEAQIVPVFEANDLSRVRGVLEESGSTFTAKDRSIIVHDVFGNVTEITGPSPEAGGLTDRTE